MANVSKEEEELRKLSIELRFLEQTAETLQQRISMLNAAMTDLTYASTALENIGKEKENAELLIPIGGSSYIQTKLASSDKVIVGMGAGVSIEKTLPEAKSILKERLEEMAKNMRSAQQQFAQIAERINVGRNRLETLITAAREGKT